MEYFVVECYCTCILREFKIFFQPSKMRKFQTLKLSQFHKEKICWTENWWSSGIMSNFWGEFYLHKIFVTIYSICYTRDFPNFGGIKSQTTWCNTNTPMMNPFILFEFDDDSITYITLLQSSSAFPKCILR